MKEQKFDVDLIKTSVISGLGSLSLFMKIKPQSILSVLVVAFFAFFVYEAREWRPQARLYPWAIGIPMLLLALVHLVLEFKGAEKKEISDAPPVDFQFTQTADRALARRRTMNILSWILGFFMSIWLIGFSLSVPLFVFLYLKVQSRESWTLSLVLTGAAWLLFWAVFVKLLTLPFPEGGLFLLINP